MPRSPVVVTQWQHFELSFRAEPGPVTLDVVGFPKELEFDANLGLLKGTPISTGVWKLSVLAKSAADIDSANVSLQVVAGAVKSGQGSGGKGSTAQTSPPGTNQAIASYSGEYKCDDKSYVCPDDLPTYPMPVKRTITFNQAANTLDVKVEFEAGVLIGRHSQTRYTGKLQGNGFAGTTKEGKVKIGSWNYTINPPQITVEFQEGKAVATGTSATGQNETLNYTRAK